MPVVIDLPTSGSPIGVGFTVAAHTDDIGPIPIDDYFLARVTLPSNDLANVQYGCRVSEGVGQTSIIIGTDQDCRLGLSVGAVGLAQGAAARLVLEHKHANGTIVSSISQPVTWDGAAMLWLYGDLHGWGTATGQAGFTATDRATLTRVDDAVYQVFPHA